MSLKVGIVGCAHMHIETYIRCLKELKVEVVGVYDRDSKRMNQFCEKNDMKAVENLERLLQSNIDTVIICSENVFHCQYTIAAASYGKHVIVEKPMALSVDDADRMIHSCKSANVKLMVAHPVRFSEPMQRLKKLINSGKTGKLIAINATNHGKSPGGWFVEKALSGGGAIIDHTIHMADLVYWLFEPEIASVFARSGKMMGEEIVEDTGLLHVTFTDGTFMSLDTSWNRPKQFPVWGDASLALVTENGWVHADGFGRKALLYNEENQPSFIYYEENMDLAMLRAFKDAIIQDLPSPVPGEAGKFTVTMANMAYRSIEIGNLIKS